MAVSDEDFRSAVDMINLLITMAFAPPEDVAGNTFEEAVGRVGMRLQSTLSPAGIRTFTNWVGVSDRWETPDLGAKRTAPRS